MTDPAHDARDAPLSINESLAQRELHRSASVSIFDVRCRPHTFAPGAEEAAEVHQIAFPRQGMFERETRGERAVADLNQVLFFNAHESYRIAHPAGCGDDCTVFVYDAAALREAIFASDPGHAETAAPPFRFAHALSDVATFMTQEALRAEALAPHPDPLAIDEAALALLHTVVRAGYQSRGKAPAVLRRATLLAHQTTAQNACLVLAQRFREDLSLQAVARAAHTSPFHLARIFRRHVGLSVHQYRLRLRLREALLRVADGERSLTRLALDLGFASHSHLSDSFHAAFGAAPATYRKLQGARSLREMSRSLEVGPARR
jgi:AraC family transcriptional regulator